MTTTGFSVSTVWRALLSAIAALIVAGFQSQTQMRAPTRRVLGNPAVEHPQDFVRVSSLRELHGQRVLVGDVQDRVLYLLDPNLKTRTIIGRKGSGPAEYASVGTLLQMGDSIWLVDLVNRRFLALHRNGTAGNTLRFDSVQTRFVGSDQEARMYPPEFSDKNGSLYDMTPGYRASTTGLSQDSNNVRRWSMRERKVEAITAVSAPMFKARSSGSLVRLPMPFGSKDEWAVEQNGTVIIVRAGSYQVKRLDTLGRWTKGPPIPYSRIPITREDQREYAESEIGNFGGRVNMKPILNSIPWPAYKPAFHGRVRIDPSGRIWVRRFTSRLTDPVVYNVIDKNNNVAEEIVFPPSTVVVGFGVSSIYAERTDETGLRFLSRYNWKW